MYLPQGKLKISFAAKHAKSAKKSIIMVFNLRIFATFSAENNFFLCVSAPLRFNNQLTLRPLRLCGEIFLF
jgi:hypothetical protein